MNATIRHYAEADRTAVFELFGRAGEGSPTGELWGHRESEAAVNLTPYVEHAAGTLLLAEDDGRLVGYLAGCLDGTAFPSESDRMERAIRDHRLLLRAGPMRFFARSALDVLRTKIRSAPSAGELEDPRWPSHLHINVVPEARGTGAAADLMVRWLSEVVTRGSPGCHLQTLVENTRAVRFFERMGFVKHGPTPLVPGIRYEGRKVHQRTMTWTAPPSTVRAEPGDH